MVAESVLSDPAVFATHAMDFTAPNVPCAGAVTMVNWSSQVSTSEPASVIVSGVATAAETDRGTAAGLSFTATTASDTSVEALLRAGWHAGAAPVQPSGSPLSVTR